MHSKERPLSSVCNDYDMNGRSVYEEGARAHDVITIHTVAKEKTQSIFRGWNLRGYEKQVLIKTLAKKCFCKTKYRIKFKE